MGGEIREIVEEIRELRAAFEEERSFLTKAYNRCVQDLQQARIEAQNARTQLAGNQELDDVGALAPKQDIEALCNEVETLCNQLEAARAEIEKERKRREEAEDLLRKVKQTLANHIAADKIREEEEGKQIREIQSKLDLEIQHRKSLEDELEKSKAKDAPRPASIDAGQLLNLQKELLAEAETRRGLEKSLLSLKESYVEQERARAREAEQQEADLLSLRADLQHERKVREATEDEMRRVRSLSISGENSQRQMLSELLNKAESDQSQLRNEKEKAEAQVRLLNTQLSEIQSKTAQNEMKELSDAIKMLQKELEDCKDKLHREELAHQDAKRRREEAEKKLAIVSDDSSTCVEEKNAAIREAARLKIQLDALKPDYEAECARAENSRREILKLSNELTEAKLSLDDLTAELADSRAKREAAEKTLVELRSMLELQAEAESSITKQNERRKRELERLRQDVESEKKLRLRAGESMQQLRADLASADERHLQKDMLMQRELETLRAEVKGERQAREESDAAAKKDEAKKDDKDKAKGKDKDLLQEISQLHDEIGLERSKCEAAQEQVSQMKKQVSQLEKDKTSLAEQLQASAAAGAPLSRAPGAGDISDGGDVQLKVDHEMQKKEVASLKDEVDSLKSSLVAARTENSMLQSRIEDLNAGADGADRAAPGIHVPGGGRGGVAGRRDSVSTTDHTAIALKMELEEEKQKWGKERADMQEQIRKLLQACMEEERESDLARRREASAREQLGLCLCLRLCLSL